MSFHIEKTTKSKQAEPSLKKKQRNQKKTQSKKKC